MSTPQQQQTVPVGLGLVRMTSNAAMLWGHLSMQLSAANTVITMHNWEFATFSDSLDLSSALTCYKEVVQVDGMFVRDGVLPRVFLGPAVWFNTQNVVHYPNGLPVLQPYPSTDPGIYNSPTPEGVERSTGETREEGKKSKIPRPPNAFILYRKHHHASVVRQNPGKHNNQISTIIGRMWALESAEVLALFKAKAEQAKLDHLQKYPGYQYQPRKPSEKKRRAKKPRVAQTASAIAAEKFAKTPQDSGKNTFVEAEGHVTLTFPLSEKTSKAVVEHNKSTSPLSAAAPSATGSQINISAHTEATDMFDVAAFGYTGPLDFTDFDNTALALDGGLGATFSADYFDDLVNIFDTGSPWENSTFFA
ncbi:hypothetical protein G7Y89_g2484 [Cudoniella acicularis]|uniref:HMG box domain-containing protein n=1 Tax=Cudoniella acicularis TaxID=354080 RepID=A0A8H4RV41_9HELO|nr:hypothetical protein G7Y89_g2484 [Cudoniella acicularis]